MASLVSSTGGKTTCACVWACPCASFGTIRRVPVVPTLALRFFVFVGVFTKSADIDQNYMILIYIYILATKNSGKSYDAQLILRQTCVYFGQHTLFL